MHQEQKFALRRQILEKELERRQYVFTPPTFERAYSGEKLNDILCGEAPWAHPLVEETFVRATSSFAASNRHVRFCRDPDDLLCITDSFLTDSDDAGAVLPLGMTRGTQAFRTKKVDRADVCALAIPAFEGPQVRKLAIDHWDDATLLRNAVPEKCLRQGRLQPVGRVVRGPEGDPYLKTDWDRDANLYSAMIVCGGDTGPCVSELPQRESYAERRPVGLLNTSLSEVAAARIGSEDCPGWPRKAFYDIAERLNRAHPNFDPLRDNAFIVGGPSSEFESLRDTLLLHNSFFADLAIHGPSGADRMDERQAGLMESVYPLEQLMDGVAFPRAIYRRTIRTAGGHSPCVPEAAHFLMRKVQAYSRFKHAAPPATCASAAERASC